MNCILKFVNIKNAPKCKITNGMIVGSAPGSTLHLKSKTVAPKHCEFKMTDSELIITAHETCHINDTEIPKGTTKNLSNADRLKIGGIVVEIELTATAAPQTMPNPKMASTAKPASPNPKAEPAKQATPAPQAEPVKKEAPQSEVNRKIYEIAERELLDQELPSVDQVIIDHLVDKKPPKITPKDEAAKKETEATKDKKEKKKKKKWKFW